MDTFNSLSAFNQALLIVCCTGLIAFGLYGLYRIWQELDS